MKSAPWILIMQIVLLVLWFTAYPALPAWLVFLPIILWAVVMAVVAGFVGWLLWREG